ncbi:MAG: GTPase RsgA [Actinobacteria bacterium]|nr:GTPase RsgA [Actinomycetota bacterium]
MRAPSAATARRPELAAELAQLGDPSLTAARVLAQHRGRWLVSDGGDSPPRLVAARGRMRAASERTPTTGDWVALDADGVIAAVLERRGTVVRRAAGAPVVSQVLAANVELVLVVEPLPEPNERRCERIVSLAAAGGVAAALVLTKADLDPGGGASAPAMARGLGLAHGIAVSVHDESSIAPLAALLEPGTTSVLLGPSGAGKSTIGFALAALASSAAELSVFDVGLRALAGGVAGCLAGWALAVAVWRQLALAELNALAARLLAAAPAPPAMDGESGRAGG